MRASPAVPTVQTRVPTEDLSRIRRLIEAATLADGSAPLSEQALLRLRPDGQGPDRHVLLRVADGPSDQVLAGYAQVDPQGGQGGQGAVAELLVHPEHRRRGLGRVLLQAVQRAAGPGSLGVWAHGDGPAARALAEGAGMVPSRTLHRWFRDLGDDLPAVVLPEGIGLRTFRPGQDEEPWLALNALAFASHPEQGRWTAQDLRARMAEPWFDPEGFLLAQADGPDGRPVLAGFHWTKIHESVPGLPAGLRAGTGRERVGEVYVVGVHPNHRGRGLGRILTVAGLHRLRSYGLRLAMLHVDGDNHVAQAVYRKLDFRHGDTDVLFVRPSIDRAGPAPFPAPEAPGEWL
ncbi:MAG: mycothiol synthase [Actinomycetota bacterium]|nr:mycothiol synthase [Actinomycetota bacterium]